MLTSSAGVLLFTDFSRSCAQQRLCFHGRRFGCYKPRADIGRKIPSRTKGNRVCSYWRERPARASDKWQQTTWPVLRCLVNGGRGQRLVNPRLPGKPSACARPRRAQPPVLRRLRHRCITLWHRNSVRNALSSPLARAWSPWSGNESRTRMPPRSCRGCRPSRLAAWSRARGGRWFS